MLTTFLSQAELACAYDPLIVRGLQLSCCCKRLEGIHAWIQHLSAGAKVDCESRQSAICIFLAGSIRAPNRRVQLRISVIGLAQEEVSEDAQQACPPTSSLLTQTSDAPGQHCPLQ